MKRLKGNRLYGWAVVFSFCLLQGAEGAPPPRNDFFREEPGKVHTPFGTYSYADEKIPRPYFAHVRAPGGIQVTRNHPPIEGQDPTDHATYHPGIWLTFGDISGNDYWRLKAKTVHERFIEKPVYDRGFGTFTVLNRYLDESGEKTVCFETCRYSILPADQVVRLRCDSTFYSEEGDFSFGDQEEFGLGIRVATPISVRKGGEMVNSEGGRNEKGVWGQLAAWCSYRGRVEGRTVGMTIVPDAKNFRPSWYHARDYGLLVANPFGRKAMKQGEESKVVVRKGDRFHLGFDVLIFSVPAEEEEFEKAHAGFVKQAVESPIGRK